MMPVVRVSSTALIFILLLGWLSTSGAEETQYRVGVAKVNITPSEPVVLAGYGGRTKPYEGVDTQLWARAFAIHGQKPHVIVAVDNCGIPEAFAKSVYETVNAKMPLERASLVLAATHTHNAPSLPGYARILWQERMTKEEEGASARYAAQLERALVKVALDAMTNGAEATLHWAQGRVTFGGNRRILRDGKWSGFGFQEDGPVDHSVPSLVARDSEGAVIGIWTNYACHCTTLGAVNRIHADWAGVASETMENDFPGAVALTTVGCGADVGPQPSGSAEIAQRHGQTLAAEVGRLVALSSRSQGEDQSNGARTLEAEVSSSATTVKLPFATTYDQAHWEAHSTDGGFDGVHAKEMLRIIKIRGSLRPEIDYRIASWQFGDELGILFLPGEVCVDYAVRLKRDHDWRRLWINGWCNAMPGYIPSRRVLDEGGYEADFSMIYYAHPSRFADSVEDTIVTGAEDLLAKKFGPVDAGLPDLFRHPGPAEKTLRDFRSTVAQFDGPTRSLVGEIRVQSNSAKPGFEKLLHSDFEETSWYDYLGRKRGPRHFVRQLREGDRVLWQTAIGPGGKAMVCFSGGMGYLSEKETAGFRLQVNDDASRYIDFDLVSKPTFWTSSDGTLGLSYLPTWTSRVDSAGFFLLAMDGLPSSEKSRPLQLCVKSRGAGSQRWFAVDANKDATKDLARFFEEESTPLTDSTD